MIKTLRTERDGYKEKILKKALIEYAFILRKKCVHTKLSVGMPLNPIPLVNTIPNVWYFYQLALSSFRLYASSQNISLVLLINISLILFTVDIKSSLFHYIINFHIVENCELTPSPPKSSLIDTKHTLFPISLL